MFSKSFPRTTDKSAYPIWEEVSLTSQEEAEQEVLCREENIQLLQQCIEDSSKIMKARNLKPFQTDMINLAIALFEKRASHQIYYKESRAKDKFDSMFK